VRSGSEWHRVAVEPAIVRAQLPDGIRPAADVDAATLDVTAGLRDHFADVVAIDAVANGADLHLVHTATEPRGEGIIIETRIAGSGTAYCWTSPACDYLADRALARAVMSGRRPGPRPTSPPGPGVPVAEVWLARGGDRTVARRRGPLGQIVLPGATRAVAVPASTLPARLFEAGRLGPRRVCGQVFVTTVESLTGTPWCLEWSVGHDEAIEPRDDDWSTARATGHGRLDLIDRDGELLLVRQELPEPLASDAREAMPDRDVVALVPVSAGDVFTTLVHALFG
jgi:hypothetical protein